MPHVHAGAVPRPVATVEPDEFADVVFADDCPLCECCGEPWCELHQVHYADCVCRGPHTVDEDG